MLRKQKNNVLINMLLEEIKEEETLIFFSEYCSTSVVIINTFTILITD